MERSQSPDDTHTSSRRALLRWGAVLSVSAFAGCTEEIGREFPSNTKVPLSEVVPKIPVKKRTKVLETGITKLANKDIATNEEFTAVLKAAGVEVDSVSERYDVLRLEYRTQEYQNKGVFHELGLAAGAYAALISVERTIIALSVTITNAHSSTVGFVEISDEYAARYNAGEYSAAEYGELVASSIKSKRGPQDHIEPENKWLSPPE